MKGISPVIAVVLLLMITISLVGFVYIYFTRITGGALNQTQSEQQAIQQQTGKRIAIDGVSGNSIVLRNVGTYEVGLNEITVFVNNQLVSLGGSQCTTGSIPPGGIVQCTMSQTCNKGSVVKVVSPGLTDQTTC